MNCRIRDMKGVISAGSPTFVRKLATILRDLFINRMNLAVALSTAAVAARGVQNDLNTLMFCIGLGLGKTLISMTGIYYSVEDRPGLRRLFITAAKTGLMISGGAGLICFVGSGAIARFYMDDPEAIALSAFSIRCMALGLVLYTLLVSFQNYLQGIQKRKLVNLMNLGERLFIPVLTAFTLGRLFGSKGIMASVAISKVLLSLMVFAREAREMKIDLEGDKMVAHPEGRIDSINTSAIGHELNAMMDDHPGLPLVIDASALQYISSAGLRVLLGLAERQEQKLAVQNVSPEVYNILEMTGSTELLNVSRRLREISVDGCEIVGRGAIGTVYRIDADTIVKVYDQSVNLLTIKNEQKNAKRAFLKGIPTAISYDIVKVGEKYGSVYEMLNAVNLNDALVASPERRDEIVECYSRFIRRIHEVEMEPGELPEAKGLFIGYLEDLRGLLGETLYARLRALLEAMPKNLHIVHGDIQMKNVMLSGDELMLIDMDTLCVGDPVFDLMGIYMTYMLFNEDEPDNSMKFLGITGEMSDFVYEKTLSCYFSDQNPAAIREAKKKICVVACVRFLYLIAVMGIGKPEL